MGAAGSTAQGCFGGTVPACLGSTPHFCDTEVFKHVDATHRMRNLLSAAYNGSLEEVRFMIERFPWLLRAVGNDARVTGGTVLHAAVAGGNIDVITWVVQQLEAHSGYTNGGGGSEGGGGGKENAINSHENSAPRSNSKGSSESTGDTRTSTVSCPTTATSKDTADKIGRSRRGRRLQEYLNQPCQQYWETCQRWSIVQASPLHIAAAEGHVGAVQVLLDHGADPSTAHPQAYYDELRTSLGDRLDDILQVTSTIVRQVLLRQPTPLLVAIALRRLSCVELLWDITTDCSSILELPKRWLLAKFVLQSKPLAANPLWVAALGDMETFAWVSRAQGGIKNTLRDRSGVTTLHVATWFGLPELVKLLVQEGADVNAATTFQATSSGRANGIVNCTPLHLALCPRGTQLRHGGRDEHMVAALLAHGADPNMACRLQGSGGSTRPMLWTSSTTPLLCAVAHHDLRKTAAEYAWERERRGGEHGGHDDDGDDDDITRAASFPFRYELDATFPESVVGRLLAAGAHADAQQYDNRDEVAATVLHLCAKLSGARANSQYRLVYLIDQLLAHGADGTATTNAGQKPADQCSRSATIVAAILRAADQELPTKSATKHC
eukprot:m.178500 g.178500  ORF g.178500 m.178500 type:complete len:609 (-) comp17982_c0_seq8:68-1894(-)